MKEDSIGDCGNDSTEDVVLIIEVFTMGKNKHFIQKFFIFFYLFFKKTIN